MGCGTSSIREHGAVLNNRIEKQIEKDRVVARREIKALLLGAGESGKSTIFKQLRIIHNSGYNKEDCIKYRPIICSNAVDSLVVIPKAMKKLEIDFSNATLLDDANRFLNRKTGTYAGVGISGNLGRVMQSLWQDEGVQSCFLKSREYHLNDSAGYYLSSLARISHPEYIPNQLDVLHSRERTVGMAQTQFRYKGWTFKLFDLGGHRSERKKWFHYFEDVNAIIFCAALSAYDLLLDEDEEVNRMEESLKLFKSICSNKWFVETAIVLFLNKTDVFAKKIQQTPLKVCFSEYEGPNTNDDTIVFIREKFEDICKKQGKKEMYTHFTCAVETKNIQCVFDVVADIIIQGYLRKLIMD